MLWLDGGITWLPNWLLSLCMCHGDVDWSFTGELGHCTCDLYMIGTCIRNGEGARCNRNTVRCALTAEAGNRFLTPHWRLLSNYNLLQIPYDFHVSKITQTAEMTLTFVLQIAIYLKPFKLNVWLPILATIPFGGIVIFIITKLSPTITWMKRRTEYGLFQNSLLFSFGALFTQGMLSLADCNISCHDVT